MDTISEDQKRKILEEEQAKFLAEEHYREQIRHELRSQIAPPQPSQPPAPSSEDPVNPEPKAGPKSALNFKRPVMLVSFGVGALALLSAVALVHQSSSASAKPDPSNALSLSSKPPTSVEKPAPVVETPVKLSTAEIAQRATKSVVIIENFNESGAKQGQGSGYVYSADGVIVTNYHVIRGASGLAIRLRSGVVSRVDTILGYDSDHDVALLQMPEYYPYYLDTQDAEVETVGDRVVAIGAPLGLESTVSEGIVSALRNVNGTHIIQTTTSISPGSSGGPLLNEYGRVIGLCNGSRSFLAKFSS